MSLINDALKRAQRTLEENAPEQGAKGVGIPSIPLEHTPGNRKRFIIVFCGGVLFFTTLILLVMLLSKERSQQESKGVDWEKVPAVAVILPEGGEVPGVSEVENGNKGLAETTVAVVDEKKPEKQAVVTTQEKPVTKGDKLVEEKDAQSEIFKDVVNLASRAFVKSPEPQKATATTKEPVKKEPAKDVEVKMAPLSTAQKTLQGLEEEAQLRKGGKDVVQKVVDGLDVTGVIFLNSGSKVMIDNKVYTVKSFIEKEGVKLEVTDIQPNEVVLKNGAGRVYRKEF